MSWQAYTLTYRAASPVALGAYKFGFIQRTRYYAPGWTLWGAITAQLTRAAFAGAAGDDYETVGRFVADNLPTSYAYILVGGQPACPNYRAGQLCYGELTAAAFESRFVTSFGQTAMAPATLTAHTNTLHETELLSPYDLGSDPLHSGEPVRWQFTLYARQPWQNAPAALDGKSVQDVIAVLDPLILGGERGYGFGRLVQTDCAPAQPCGGAEWPTPLDWCAETKTLRAHVEIDTLKGLAIAVYGQIEPVARRLWQNEVKQDGAWGPGQRRKVHRLYVPGSRIEGEWTPAVGPLGLWQTA